MTRRFSIAHATGRSLTAGLAAVACLALASSLVSTVDAEALADEEAPVLFEAALPSSEGQIAVYAVSAREATSGPLESWQMQASASRSGSTYTATLDPARISPEAIRPGGLVDFEVILEGEDGPRSTWTTARIVSVDGRLDWADPVETAHLGATARATNSSVQPESVDAVPTMTQRQAAELVSTHEETGVALSSFGPVPEPAHPASTVTAAATCRYPYWIYTDTYRTRPATIGTTYPVGNDKARMSVSSSQGANYGMALSSKGAYTGFAVNGSRFIKTGWSFQWAWSKAQRSYQKGIKYQLMRKTCYGNGTYKPGYIWRPVGETGGTGENKGLTRPSWKNCAPVVAGKWSRDKSSGSAYAYGAGVKFKSLIGIDLSVKRNYSSNQKLVYKLLKKRRMCGNNAKPATASKVMSRKAK